MKEYLKNAGLAVLIALLIPVLFFFGLYMRSLELELIEHFFGN